MLDPALAHSMMEYGPNGHVAKVPGKGDCKSRPLAMSFQAVVLYRHILLLHFTQVAIILLVEVGALLLHELLGVRDDRLFREIPR